MCVCVCVFDITYSPHPPLYPLGVHSPIIWLVGGPRLHVSRLFPILTRGSIHPLYHGGHCVCVGVCVFDIACSSHPALHFPDAHSPFIYLVGGATLTCVKIASNHCPRLNPPCVSRGTLCVCVGVYVCHCMLPPPPTAYSQCSWPINLIGGGPRQHVYILCSILARGSIHPVCHEGHSVCVCLFALACFPHPNASSSCSKPINLISGGPRQHVSSLLPIIARESIHPVYHGGHCVCVCVCLPLPAHKPPTRPPDFHSPLI